MRGRRSFAHSLVFWIVRISKSRQRKGLVKKGEAEQTKKRKESEGWFRWYHPRVLLRVLLVVLFISVFKVVHPSCNDGLYHFSVNELKIFCLYGHDTSLFQVSCMVFNIALLLC